MGWWEMGSFKGTRDEGRGTRDEDRRPPIPVGAVSCTGPRPQAPSRHMDGSHTGAQFAVLDERTTPHEGASRRGPVQDTAPTWFQPRVPRPASRAS